MLPPGKVDGPSAGYQNIIGINGRPIEIKVPSGYLQKTNKPQDFDAIEMSDAGKCQIPIRGAAFPGAVLRPKDRATATFEKARSKRRLGQGRPLATRPDAPDGKRA